jgi:5'-methylthioadenosine phosphorylase
MLCFLELDGRNAEYTPEPRPMLTNRAPTTLKRTALVLTLLLCAAVSAFTTAEDAKKPHIAIVGGTFINDALLLRDDILGEPFTVDTDLGESPPIYPGHANGIDFYYVHGHGRPSLQAAWVALYDLGVTEVIGGATAGGINPAMQPYDYVIPHDFIDMNVNRPLSFPREIYRDPDAIPIPRVYPAMDPDLRTILSEETRKRIRADSQFDDIDLHEAGVIVQARGGRFETAAEIRMFAQWGGDVVTMNVGTEIAYARMLGMNYACLIAISNPAEGVAPWDFSEMPPLYRRINPLSVEILMAALPRIAGLEGKPRVGDDLVFHPEMTSKPEGD